MELILCMIVGIIIGIVFGRHVSLGASQLEYEGMSLVRCESINLIRTADLICFWSCPIRERMRYIRKDM